MNECHRNFFFLSIRLYSFRTERLSEKKKPTKTTNIVLEVLDEIIVKNKKKRMLCLNNVNMRGQKKTGFEYYTDCVCSRSVPIEKKKKNSTSANSKVIAV